MAKKCPGEDEKRKDEGRDWLQILAVFIGCLTTLENGIHFSWTSPFFVQLTKDTENYDISEDHASYFTTLPPIFQILSCPIFSVLCDRIGRKTTLLIGGVPFILACILETFAENVYVFHVARCLTGIGASANYIALSMYAGEICKPRVRDFWVNFLVSINASGGLLLINLIGFYFDVHQTAYILLVPGVLFQIAFPFMPESPYYLLMKRKEDAARNSLQRLLQKEDVEEDFVELQADVKRQMSETGTWKDLFCIVANRKALFVGVLMRVAQQFGGSAFVAAYTSYIFEESGGDAKTATLIYSGVFVGVTIIASFCIDRFGRKMSFIISMFLCAACMLYLSVFYYIKDCVPQWDVSNYTWVPLIGMMAYIVFSAFGVSNIPNVMLGELFSASIKAKGLNVLISVMGLLISLTSYLFYLFSSSFGMYTAFFVFSLISFGNAVWCIFVLPETKGKTLEQIQQEFNGNKPLKSDRRDSQKLV
ncbi:unnamed protein product [Acanthoscelides obtectus]|uniref:Major facilitator superfamily (MFS) profile domain-containing protein n=1 Tax=Acanthoscelides obtectus TaxID=200917 RepID=A0A9P0L305_ACAOB|nr:unnamed protein product [Acanthoscelides obtectus]CAK1650903.1 Facilitated trehalose transporter Tret1 [Acanthoscelides obtectus]